MEDTKNIEKVEEVELLRLQLIAFRLEASAKAHNTMAAQRDEMVKALTDKYGAFQSITEDGTIVRAPTPLQSVPEGA